IARQALEELLRQATGLDRARVLLQFGRLLAPTEPDAAADLLAEAGPLSSADRALGAQITEAIASVEAMRDAPAPMSTDPPPALGPLLEPDSARALSSPMAQAIEESEEERLQRELAEGSFEAGEQLVALHGSRPERSPDVLAARRQQALIKLGDRAALQKLLE